MNLKLLIFLFLVVLKCSFGTQRKHVVIIVADDLGWNDVSFHGSNEFLTPNIDALAYSGVILNNYYTMSLCSPSRSALMTGIHPIHTGMYHEVLLAPEPYGLPLDIKILPQYLKDYGYATHAVGKWHLGNYKEAYTPMKRGFDSHFGYWTANGDYYTHMANDLGMMGKDFRRNESICWDYEGQYATDLFTDESVNIINSHNASQPLFLYLAHLAVHSANPLQPLQAPEDVIKKFSHIKSRKRQIYAAMVWKLDESVGKVVSALAQKDMLKDTIIIFTTDNGGAAGGFDFNVASNWPLRGVKATLWEGGVRGAAFIWSADLPHSKVNGALMHIQDWLPTILAAIDENSLVNSTLKQLDGRNMWPVLKGLKEFVYDELIIQRDDISHIAALRKNEWKLITGVRFYGIYDKWFGPDGRDGNSTYNIAEIEQSLIATALKNSNLTFPSEDEMIQLRNNITLKCDYCNAMNRSCTRCNPKIEPCLFNIAEDPCEMINLAGKYPQIMKDMLKRLKAYTPVTALNKPIDLRAIPKFWNNTWTNWMDYVDTKFSAGANALLLSMNTMTTIFEVAKNFVV